MKEPTGDQCDDREIMFEDNDKIGHACWYPQMGGYVGKCVAVFDKKWTSNGYSREGGCIELYVWHDGEFPFGENDGNPRNIHICDGNQFIEFGEFLENINNKYGVIEE